MSKNRTLFKMLFYFSVIKAMFVNSCLYIVGTCNIDLGVMDWKSAWPTCHGTVISVVMVQWFCSISETQIDIWTSYLQILKWYDTIIHPQYSMTYMSWFSDFCLHGPVILSYIRKPIWHMNIISPDFEMVWHNNSPQYSMTYMSWFSDFCLHGP